MKALKHLIILKLLVSFGFLSFAERSFSQADSAVLCMLEMIRLKASYSDSSDISFNVKFFSSQKDTTGLYVTDSMNGSYKIKGNNFWSYVDSVEQIQNEQYFITLFPEEKMMIVQKPDHSLKTILSKDFLDTAFQQLDVSGMLIINYGASKKLSMFFKPESYYLSYDIYYDTATYLINKFEYKVKENTDYLKISMLFSDYDTSPIEHSIFSTSSYFTTNGNEHTPTDDYSDYELIDPLTKIWYEPS